MSEPDIRREKKESMKTKIKLNFLFPLATAVMAIVWMCKGAFEYGLWDEASATPADGLFPLIIATVLLLASIVNIVTSFKEEPVTFDKKALILVAALAAIYIASKYIGFLPTLFIFYVLWLRLFGKVSWKHTIIATVVMFVIVYFGFSVWLKISFPMGSLFEMLR